MVYLEEFSQQKMFWKMKKVIFLFNKNIEELMFMDFGFGPLLYQEELYILAPPEIVFCLFENRD